MESSTVINNAPWVTALGSVCATAALFVRGPVAVAFAVLGLIVTSAAMGAMLTHYPKRSTAHTA